MFHSLDCSVGPGLLLLLQIMSKFIKNILIYFLQIFCEISQVILQNRQDFNSRTVQNWRHHFLLGYVLLTLCAQCHHTAERAALQRFHTLVRKKECFQSFSLQWSRHFTSVTFFHTRSKYQTAFFRWVKTGFYIVVYFVLQTHLQFFEFNVAFQIKRKEILKTDIDQ